MKKILIASSLTLLLGGCFPHIHHDHDRGYDRGPPAHAPAHGYRKKMHNHDMSFDSGLGVYVVVGSPGFYFWDDFYWRLRDGFWVRASAFDGPWIVVEETHRHLPPGLAKKHGYGKSKAKDQGKGKAKGKDKNK